MTTWAYRIFSFGVKYGAEELPLNEDLTRDAFFEMIEHVASNNVLRGLPKQRSSGDGDVATDEEDEPEYESYAPSSPTLTVRSAERRSDNHIHLIVGMGEAGLHETLSDPEKQTSTNIQKQSAEVSLRLDFFFPEEGTKGIIVSEVQGMRDPVLRLLKWMALFWKERKDELERDARLSRDEWVKLNEEGKAVGPKPKVLRLRNYYFKASRLADPELLKKIIREAKEGTAEFFELGPDGKRKHTLTRALRSREDITSAGRLLSSAFGAGSADLKDASNRAVLQLADDLGYDTEELERGGIDVEDAKLRLKTDEMSASFDSTHASDVFTYKFQKGRPKDSGFYSMTLSKVAQLSEPAGIEMAAVAWEEVTEWLEIEGGRSPSDLT